MHGADQRADPRPAAPRVPADRHARRRQDDDRADPREEPQLPHQRRHRDAVRHLRRVHRHRRRPLRRPARARRGVEHRHRQHARDPRQRALRADRRPLQGLPDRRSAHAVEGRVQLDAEDARGAARARQVRAGDDRSAEDPGHRAVALPAVQPEAAAAGADRRAPGADPRGGEHRRRPRGAGADRARRAGLDARRAVAARPGDRLRRRRSARSASCARCWARSTPSTSTGSSTRCCAATARRCSPRSMRWRRAASPSPPALEELASLFHRIAVAQAVPAAAATMDDAERIAALAAGIAPEARCSSPTRSACRVAPTCALAPDEATGFSMTLLRLLAFEPGGHRGRQAIRGPARRQREAVAVPRRQPARTPGRRWPSAPSVAAAPRRRATPDPVTDAAARRRGDRPPAPSVALPTDPARLAGVRRRASSCAGWRPARGADRAQSVAAATCSTLGAARDAQPPRRQGVRRQAQGRARRGDGTQAACSPSRSVRRAEASLAAQERRERAEQKAKTEAAFRDEPFVRDVLARFDAKIKPDSIKPVS